jgi:DNA-binding MarR family transcriptional regulator
VQTEAGGGADRDAAFSAVERELVVLLRRARGAAGLIARELHPDLEPAAYGLLVRIADVGTARVTELADYFGIDKAAVSRQVKGLEHLGLVTRERDPEDARAFRLAITTAGLDRLNETRRARRERVRRQLDSWTAQDVAKFAALLSRFNAEVDLAGR